MARTGSALLSTKIDLLTTQERETKRGRSSRDRGRGGHQDGEKQHARRRSADRNNSSKERNRATSRDRNHDARSRS
ncbi:unnamed protein product, partial [Amoebophrya sp. A120]|eukprot:GSA120T00023088001.1